VTGALLFGCSETTLSGVRGEFSADEADFVISHVPSGIRLESGVEEVKQMIGHIAEKTAGAVNTYYAFGSCFVDDI